MEPDDYDVIYPNPTPDNAVLKKNVPATMGDGVQLAVDVYRPKQGRGPWPVIFAYSPFQKERFFESAKPEFYCANGYVCVQASERGSGFNSGKFEFHGAKAAQDGYELVEWIAAQPWCSGPSDHDGGFWLWGDGLADGLPESTPSKGASGSGHHRQLSRAVLSGRRAAEGICHEPVFRLHPGGHLARPH